MTAAGSGKAGRVLHLLSQRPSMTGSGITLDALVAGAARAGWEQAVAIGIPADEPAPPVAGLSPDRVHPLRFGREPLPFPVPGMSDVMPYPSTVFSTLGPPRLDAYRAAWREHVASLVERYRPDVIHAHHVWILAGMLADVAPGVPVVNHCHATGLRQMELCPRLADEVRRGCSRNARFVVLHAGYAEKLERALGVAADRIRIVGAGYREDFFHRKGLDERSATRVARILYVGKYAAAKGLPWLLDAFDRLRADRPELELRVAGDGAGEEAESLRDRMRSLEPAVHRVGQVPPARLGEEMRAACLCVLPSFYEGVPLVLVEAVACGCRLVATDLDGVRREIAPAVGDAIEIVPLPRLVDVDRPVAEDVPRFVEDLTEALARALDRARAEPVPPLPAGIERFRWSEVFRRVEATWREVIEERARA